MSSCFEYVGNYSNDDAAEVERRDKNLEKLVNFFDADTRLKKTMISLAPTDHEAVGEDGAIAYSDRLYEGLGEMTYDLKRIMANYYQSEEIDDTLDKIQQRVINAGCDFDKLQKAYKTEITGMSPEFVKAVQGETHGYSVFSNAHMLDAKVTSINEILHLIHSSVVNDDRLLQDLPVLAKNDEKDGFVLFGQENPIAKEIFDSISQSSVDGHTDIIGLKDRVLMMIRDYGHATTLDIQEENGKYYVNYFIPKVCNVEKINQLPGLQNQVTSRKEQASGVFEVKNGDSIGSRVTDFVSRIPTDADIIL